MEKFPSFFFRQFWPSNNSRPCKLATSIHYSSVLSKTSIAPFTIYPYSLAVHTDEPAYQSTPIIIRLIRPRSRFKHNGPSCISLRYPQKLKQYPIYSTIYFFFHVMFGVMIRFVFTNFNDRWIPFSRDAIGNHSWNGGRKGYGGKYLSMI